MRSTLLPALIASALVSCVTVSPPGILVATTPPGARVLVDGEETGFVTPCNIALDRDDHLLELRLAGYSSTRLSLRRSTRRTVVPWSSGIVTPVSWPFPLFLPAKDLLLPIRIDRSPLPSRIHVELRLSAEG